MLVYQRVRYWKCLHWSGGSPNCHVESRLVPWGTTQKICQCESRTVGTAQGAKEIVGIVGMEFHGIGWNKQFPSKQLYDCTTPCVYIYIYMCVYIYIYTHNNTSTPPGTLGIAHQKFPFSKSLTIDGFDLKEIFNSNRSSECFELSYCRFTFPKNNVHFKRTFIF